MDEDDRQINGVVKKVVEGKQDPWLNDSSAHVDDKKANVNQESY